MDKKEKIKLMLVCPYFYPKIGGLENYAYNLGKRLQESGDYQVSVVTSNHLDGTYHKEIVDGMSVHRLPILFVASNSPINPFWYQTLKKIIKEEKPDIINTHSPVPFLADLAVFGSKDIPVVMTYHAGSMLKGRFFPDVILYPYEKIILPLLFKKAKAIVAISQSFINGQFPQFKNKVSFIPTGADLSRFKPTPLPDTKIVSFIGRIEKSSSWKGIDQLLTAMSIVIKKYPDARLEIVGTGDAVELYKQQAVELGIENAVDFAGSQSGEGVVSAYVRSNVVVLPSTSNAEAFSVSLVEAMASGRPIIGTNIGGTPQVIEDGKNGFLVDPKDPQALADAIEKILGNKDLAKRLGDNGAEMVKGYSWEIQAKKYRDLFDGVLEKKK